MKKWWKRTSQGLLPRVGYWAAQSLWLSMRLRTEGKEKIAGIETGIIFCGWHGRSYAPAMMFKKKGFWVIISHSKDGEMQNKIFSRLGFNVIRGSTGRGGVRAALEGIKILKEGGKMAITPDGPRGPYGVVQGGVILMARKSGAALVPLGISAKPRKLAQSWDRYMIPFPFSKALVIFDDPIYIPEDASEELQEELRLKLEMRIHELHSEAECKLGIKEVPVV
jgi:hypothetical protein